MHRTTKIAATFAAPAALAAAALIATATAANASTAIDANGTGFIGKGDVQTALGMNNAAMQKAVDAGSLVFTATQPYTQALRQDAVQLGSQTGTQVGRQSATQIGTQSATQAVSETLTCTYTNGSVKNPKIFH